MDPGEHGTVRAALDSSWAVLADRGWRRASTRRRCARACAAAERRAAADSTSPTACGEVADSVAFGTHPYALVPRARRRHCVRSPWRSCAAITRRSGRSRMLLVVVGNVTRTPVGPWCAVRSPSSRVAATHGRRRSRYRPTLGVDRRCRALPTTTSLVLQTACGDERGLRGTARCRGCPGRKPVQRDPGAPQPHICRDAPFIERAGDRWRIRDDRGS